MQKLNFVKFKGSADKTLAYVQHNDQIKNDYCKNNNVKLIRIRFNENIEEKLIFLNSS
jgi:hypothetical protein